MRNKLTWKRALALLGMGRWMRGMKNAAFDRAGIEASIYYLRGINRFRIMLIHAVQILCLGMFFVTGVVMLEAALLFLLPSGGWIKALGAVILSLIHIGAAGGFLYYLLSSRRWVKVASRFNALVRSFAENSESPGDENIKPGRKGFGGKQ